ncbi:hypothetical protein HQQ94_07370 [Shewanella sp. VB17]|uniref:hypothetical protein n=1 Tax=Shewanella sp. VB17 TaxID=2739432 RepID=UPI001565FD08|nr:hypothetical protein [Shewanella sp. VB17]NRD73062.1 hypothetical protein [Shewanella sp. VB17]
MNLSHVLLITALLGISACATSVYDTIEMNVEQDTSTEVLDNTTDPMVEHNERLIKEGREDMWQKNI